MTVLAASRASPPGIDPIPVAAPAAHFRVPVPPAVAFSLTLYSFTVPCSFTVLFSLTQEGYAAGRGPRRRERKGAGRRAEGARASHRPTV
ncbi:putative iron ABC transporter permease [Streptomyces sp. NBRC 110611]|nr:putative iron ABC transporter permease [Streptomyces sp. NBRC 110611]